VNVCIGRRSTIHSVNNNYDIRKKSYSDNPICIRAVSKC